MKIRNFALLLITICLLISSQAYGQVSRQLRRALEEYDAGHYSTAVDLLRKSYMSARTNEEQGDILFKMAECYRIIGQPVRAELWYKKAVAKAYRNPIVHLRLGEVLIMNAKYVEAREEFQKYKERVPNDRRADDGLRSSNFAIEEMEKSYSGYIVENVRFMNSRQSDFSPIYASEDYTIVYFTSSRDAATGKNINSVTGQKFTDIFETRLDRKGAWSQPVPVEGDINTEHDEGMPSFTPDFRTMYFTRCKSSPNKAWGCQIYVAQLVNGRWTRERNLNLAGDTVIVAHPAISPDELTLYFVSDMPGGQGGKDIWKVTRSNVTDSWGRPQNLGPQINTPNDEMFPYVHPDGTLYFSSNGHVGLGGLDIFKAKEENGRWTVENMGYPINSSKDDFGITFQAEQERGYFTSNREMRGNVQVDNIYQFSLPPLAFELIGLVIDEKTEQPLPNATVRVIGSDGRQSELRTGADGTFRTPLNASTDYVLTASQPRYLNGRERESTRGHDRSRNFEVTIALMSVAQPIEIPNIWYEFGSAELVPESFVALEDLVSILADNPTITIELGAHTDSRGSDAINNELSQRRAQTVVNFLISKGVDNNRLIAKGYGKTSPKRVDEEMATQYPFLREGIILSETYVNALSSADEQEIAHRFNRRTEFRVIQ